MFNFIKELGKVELEFDFEGEKIVFKNYIKSTSLDYLLVDLLYYNGVEFNLPEKKWLKAKFKENGGVYVGNCQILGKDNSKFPGIKISYPQNVTFVQQREFVRVPLRLRIELVIFPLASSEGEEIEVIDSETLDVSGSGFCFVSEKPIKLHSKIIGVIYLNHAKDRQVEVNLLHVYSRPFQAAGKEVYKNAFTFIDIDENSKEKILKDIFLYELEQRRKGM